MPPRPADMSDEVYELQDFTVTAEQANQLMANIELRMDSDKMLNLFSAEDFSKFAASDVADALKRVSGVSIVEGQFAVIRGLSDRYNSTTFNGAAIPSPDPLRQSVQLDLFPSEVVSNLSIAKSFSQDLPSNSAGGSIDIQTTSYPDEFTVKLSSKVGINENAQDRFLSANPGFASGTENNVDPIDKELSFSVGGPLEIADKHIRISIAGKWEEGFDSAFGEQESLRAHSLQAGRFQEYPDTSRNGQIQRNAGLADGELLFSNGKYNYTKSEYTEDKAIFAGLGFDLDDQGNHSIDFTIFHVESTDETVTLKENGAFPNLPAGFPVSPNSSYYDDWLRNYANPGSTIYQAVNSGEFPGGVYTLDGDYYETSSFIRERELDVLQANGSHDFDFFKISWAINQSETTQDESVRTFNYYSSDGGNTFRAASGNQGPTNYFGVDNSVTEDQDFARIDISREYEASDNFKMEMSAGLYYTKSERDSESTVIDDAISTGGAANPVATGNTALATEQGWLNAKGNIPSVSVTSDANRKINAMNFGGKLTLFEKFDLIGGLRMESLKIGSENNPEIPGQIDLRGQVGGPLSDFADVPAIFPSIFTMFEPYTEGNASGFRTRAGDDVIQDNTDLLNIDGPTDIDDPAVLRSLLTGSIQEELSLPSLGFAYRPFEGMRLRFNYSESVARPSLREISYYVSADPSTEALLIGNPQLGLSDVKSYDLRAEYVTDIGDMVAISFFTKDISAPIEKAVIVDPFLGTEFQTYFNNDNDAELRGVEFEFRKNLAFVPVDFLQYFTVGGNFTYVDASVERDQAQVDAFELFFEENLDRSGQPRGDPAKFTSLSKERRLFEQPEWIANADITFEQPDWGTSVTLALFAISDVLESTGFGQAATSQNPSPTAVLDRYVDSYLQLDLIMQQEWRNWTFKFTAKNLTDSERRLFYDGDNTVQEYEERSFRVGRSYSFSASYAF